MITFCKCINLEQAKENTFPGQIQPEHSLSVTSVEGSSPGEAAGPPGEGNAASPDPHHLPTLPPTIDLLETGHLLIRVA